MFLTIISKKNLQLKTDGIFKLSSDLAVGTSLKKKYTLTDDSMEVQYILKNDSSINISSFFMVEMSLAFETTNKKSSKISIYAEDVKKDLQIEELLTCPSFKSIPWLQLVDIDGRIKFTMELNEPSSVILIPIYRKDAETISANIVGVRILFYWNVELKPEHDTEKMMFFRTLDSKKK